MTIKQETYNTLKFIAQIGLPALGTLYFALAGIWNLPSPEKVIGTIIAVDTFLGVLLGITTKPYDGTMNVIETPEKTLYSLEFDKPQLEDLAAKAELRLKVAKNPK